MNDLRINEVLLYYFKYLLIEKDRDMVMKLVSANHVG